ncbi:MAG: type II toxin-antitoxin system RelE/ParE family toxin [Acidobacteria bacterium]|nr:type II toxin-antitoxin system RelE/ParE family toxin [Acidobacteriota bacterium]MBI3282146.1 type II toxin-antitoxin system RelE/ParE family toxin [Acidobacteriota bacterium]
MGQPRVFKTRWFQRLARKERLADAALLNAADRAEKGQVDADLGGGVIKRMFTLRRKLLTAGN